VVINAILKNRTTYYSYINVELLLSNVIHCLTFSVKLSQNRWHCYHPLLRKGELTKIIENTTGLLTNEFNELAKKFA